MTGAIGLQVTRPINQQSFKQAENTSSALKYKSDNNSDTFKSSRKNNSDVAFKGLWLPVIEPLLPMYHPELVPSAIGLSIGGTVGLYILFSIINKIADKIRKH